MTNLGEMSYGGVSNLYFLTMIIWREKNQWFIHDSERKGLRLIPTRLANYLRAGGIVEADQTIEYEHHNYFHLILEKYKAPFDQVIENVT